MFLRRQRTDPFDAGRSAAGRGDRGPRRGLHRQRPPLHPRTRHRPRPPAQPAAPAAARPRRPWRPPRAICPAGSRRRVGGDWFDVIPLSGARVALVVGDVVGHGIQAAATMGRLRTAVRTLADLDLPPDELLAHLDDLGRHDWPPRARSRRAGAAAERPSTPGLRRHLPVRGLRPRHPAAHLRPGRTSPARRGHSRRPRRVPGPPRGPPLGVGGLPFEATEVELPEGSLLVALHRRPGRVARPRHRRRARPAARAPWPTTAATCRWTRLCDTVVSPACSRGSPPDDVALLLARTRALGADHVAAWDLPADPPSSPGPGPHVAAPAVDWWQLDELVFTTELVVSELVTNAIRYGPPPDPAAADPRPVADLRGVRQQRTAPHLRRARDLRRGRPRTAPRRPAQPALGHPALRRPQDHLGRAAAERSAPVVIPVRTRPGRVRDAGERFSPRSGHAPRSAGGFGRQLHRVVRVRRLRLLRDDHRRELLHPRGRQRGRGLWSRPTPRSGSRSSSGRSAPRSSAASATGSAGGRC